MRDPEINLSSRLSELQAKLQLTTDESIKRQIREDMRHLERRTREIQRMKAYGVKFRRIL